MTAAASRLKSSCIPDGCRSSSTPYSLFLVCGVGEGVHVGDVESGSLDGNLLVVDLGAVGGVEGVDLATVGGVDLVLVLDPAEAGEIAVVEGVLIGVGIRNGRAAAWSDVREDLRGIGAEIEAGEAVVVLAMGLTLAGGT